MATKGDIISLGYSFYPHDRFRGSIRVHPLEGFPFFKALFPLERPYSEALNPKDPPPQSYAPWA